MLCLYCVIDDILEEFECDMGLCGVDLIVINKCCNYEGCI